MTDASSLSLIRAALADVAPSKADAISAVDLQSNIAALGIDSIGLLEASLFIEEAVGANFPDDRLARVETVGDFVDLIRDFGANPPPAA